MKIIFLSIVFFLFCGILNINAFDFFGWMNNKSESSQTDEQNDKYINDNYEEFFENKINELISINNLKNVKVERLNSLGVNGKVLLENAIIFVVQFFKTHPNFSVKILSEKLNKIKNEQDPQKVETVENFVIFKALYMVCDNNDKVKAMLNENTANLMNFKFIKSTSSVNLRFLLNELKIPEQLFLSYIATRDYQFIKRLCCLYFDLDEEFLNNAKISFDKNINFEEMTSEEKYWFKKYVFYLSSMKILKDNFEIVKNVLHQIISDSDIHNVVKNNVGHIITEKEKL